MQYVVRLLLVWVIVFCAPVTAQSFYEGDLSQLSSQLRALMVQADRIQPRDNAGQLALLQELVELSKQLHRLEEEALKANLELQRKGHSPDRQLLLAAAIAKTLDLARSLTDHYVVTQDRVFWSPALAAAQAARTMQTAQE